MIKSPKTPENSRFLRENKMDFMLKVLGYNYTLFLQSQGIYNMVERYSRAEMSSKWDLQAKYNAWLQVELAAVKAWNALGLIDDKDCEKILKNAKFDIKRIDEIEKATKHDVIAFLTSVSIKFL